jgi:hypothetical protein
MEIKLPKKAMENYLKYKRGIYVGSSHFLNMISVLPVATSCSPRFNLERERN